MFHEEKITDVVVTLLNPRLDGQNLTYDVRILDGDMPASGGESSLFIDPVGRPMSPGSVAGVHRRERRRGTEARCARMVMCPAYGSRFTTHGFRFSVHGSRLTIHDLRKLRGGVPCHVPS
jgi:hypothetical protein